MAFPKRRLRRLLLVPAAALVVIGAPAVALDQPSADPAPKVEEVPVAPGQAIGAGYEHQVAVDSADLVGVKWQGDPDAKFTVEVRGADGKWSTSDEIGTADTGADAGSQDAARSTARGTLGSEPVAVDGASAVRVTVERGNVHDVSVAAVNSNPVAAPSGSAGALGSLIPRIDGPDRYTYAIALFVLAALLGAFALGWSPWRRHRRGYRNAAILGIGVVLLAGCIPPAPPPDNPAFTHGTVQPPIITRAQWGARPFACGTPDIASHLGYAVIHHTDSPNGDSPSYGAARVASIQAYHMDALGYCDIAYNFLIDRYGQIFEGRAGGIDKPVIAAHAGGFNTYSTGIALIGTYTSVRPPAAQYNALVNLLRWRLSVGYVNPGFGFATITGDFAGAHWPAGTPVAFASGIIGHRDVDQTGCPGDAFYPMLGQVLNDVLPGLEFPPVPTTTAPPTTTTTSTTVPATTTTT